MEPENKTPGTGRRSQRLTASWKGNTLTLDWITCRKDEAEYVWEWRSRMNNDGWLDNSSRTKEPQVDLWGGLATASFEPDGLIWFRWNDVPGGG